MENLYGLLNCSPTSTVEEMKKCYHRLALQYHPDKSHNQCTEGTVDDLRIRFDLLTKAWRVLSDPVMRKEYDARWQQRTVSQQWAIQEDLELGDFDEFEEDVDKEEKLGGLEGGDGERERGGACGAEREGTDGGGGGLNITYSHPCRCGGEVELSSVDVVFLVDAVCCSTCSLCYRVIYSQSDSLVKDAEQRLLAAKETEPT